MLEIISLFIAISIVFISMFLFKKKKKTEIQKPAFPSEPQVYIYYGSQTGTAAKLSEQLQTDAKSLNINAKVIDL